VDPKSKDTWRNQKGMKCFATNNKIWKLSDSSKQKEGRAIDIASIDEVWALQDDGIYKPIQQSTSTKDRFKIFMFGSEGFINDGFLDKKRKEYEAIIRGEDCKDSSKRKLPWLYTQDSEMEVWNTDTDGLNRAWMKSNPSLGTVKKWDYIKDRVEEARESKGDRIFVLSKDFNIKTAGSEAWLNLEDYEYECSFDPEELRGSFALGAVDLAETTDLCAAKILVMKPEDPRKYVLSHYFIPEGKLEEHDDKGAGAKYQEWAKDGLLTITPGTDIDLSVVADWFYQLYTDYGIRMWKCGYDQRFAKDWITRMDFYGWQRGSGDNSDLIMIIQNAQTLSNAIRTAEADFKHQLIWYGNNEMDKWNFGNAGISVDKRGQALIVKMETEKRIDGAVCLAILYETFRRYRSDYTQMIMNGGK
jgi:phage terminase large subunit-like protein